MIYICRQVNLLSIVIKSSIIIIMIIIIIIINNGQAEIKICAETDAESDPVT